MKKKSEKGVIEGTTNGVVHNLLNLAMSIVDDVVANVATCEYASKDAWDDEVNSFMHAPPRGFV